MLHPAVDFCNWFPAGCEIERIWRNNLRSVVAHDRVDISAVPYQFPAELEGFKETSVDFSKIIPKALNSVVTIGKKSSTYFSTAGSGVMINGVGHIVTNYHVVDDLGKISVRTHDNNEYSATLVGKNEAWDIAVIKLITEKKTFDYLEWGDSSKVNVGESVIAIGNPVVRPMSIPSLLRLTGPK